VVDASLKTNWPRRGAWDDILVERPADAARPAGVAVIAREDLGVAGLSAPRGGEAALAGLVAARYGVELPAPGRAARGAAHTFVWAGPGQWLLVADRREDFAEELKQLLPLAAVSDQSDARAALRLTGPKVRDMLAKGCMIDLHPSAFPPGAAATTAIAHIGVCLWRVDEPAQASEAAFDLLVPRSMAASFWSWAEASAAEFGCSVAVSP
jgi:sarcosine oxidase subunit gamma